MMYGLKMPYLTLVGEERYKNFFVRTRELNELVAQIRRTLASGRIPRMVIYGTFGIGKSHASEYIIDQIKDVAKSVYVKCPPLHRRSRFNELHMTIMRALGRTYVLQLLEKGINLARGSGKKLDEYFRINPDLVYIIETAFDNGQLNTLWKYVSGATLTSREAQSIQAVSKQLNEDDAVSIINLLAKLIRQLEDRELMLFIDELESTHPLTGDSLLAFAEAFRELTDEWSQVGLFLIMTARGFEEFPSFLDPKGTYPYVARRIGLSNYIFMREYTEEELRDLIRSAIRFRREENFDVDSTIRSIQSKEGVLREEYPFTAQAINLVLEKVKAWKDGGLIYNLRPKEVLDILDSSLSIGLQENLPIIDSSVIMRVCENIEKSLTGR